MRLRAIHATYLHSAQLSDRDWIYRDTVIIFVVRVYLLCIRLQVQRHGERLETVKERLADGGSRGHFIVTTVTLCDVLTAGALAG